MAPEETAPQRLPWGVAALLLATQDALSARFGAVAVRGELSGFTRAASGHCYFSLKDADGAPALLRCAMFRRAATLLDFQPADGQHQLRVLQVVGAERGGVLLVQGQDLLGAVGAGEQLALFVVEGVGLNGQAGQSADRALTVVDLAGVRQVDDGVDAAPVRHGRDNVGHMFF